MATKSRDYKVGYGKPPQEHQFKKGQSGNKAGRPKRSRNVSTVLAAQLDRPMQVRIGGKTKSLPAREVVLRSLIEKAARGDLKAIDLALRYELARIKAETGGEERPAGGVLVVPEPVLAEIWEQRAQALREKQRKDAEQRAQEARQMNK